jgi:2-haloacid dehalogenase
MSDTSLSRRLVLGGAAASFVSPAASAAPSPSLQAIGFDAFTLFDSRSIVRASKVLVPDKGEELAKQWLAKLFGYSWLVTAAGRYQDFETLADAALRFTATSLSLDLPERTRTELLASFTQLDLWPDVRATLSRLRAAGVRLAFLSNLSEVTILANVRAAGIEGLFEPPLSTDRVRHFKPSPAAYQMAIDAFGLSKEQIGFCAFGGWDAAGATWFGYRTVWINRLRLPAEPLDARPEITTPGLEGLLTLTGLG